MLHCHWTDSKTNPCLAFGTSSFAYPVIRSGSRFMFFAPTKCKLNAICCKYNDTSRLTFHSLVHSRLQSSSPLRMTGRAVEELWEILENSWLWLAVGRTMARRGVENEIAKYWLYAYADFPRALRFSTADKKTWALESRMTADHIYMLIALYKY